jgi:6-phosphogluconate dehydrogenase
VQSALLPGQVTKPANIDREQLINDVEAALYCSKICSYAQGMNLIRAASVENNWGVNLGECARIWKGGCIIRAQFLDGIKKAYDREANLPSLLIDPSFAQEVWSRHDNFFLWCRQKSNK